MHDLKIPGKIPKLSKNGKNHSMWQPGRKTNHHHKFKISRAKKKQCQKRVKTIHFNIHVKRVMYCTSTYFDTIYTNFKFDHKL